MGSERFLDGSSLFADNPSSSSSPIIVSNVFESYFSDVTSRFGTEELTRTVKLKRHIFLRYKNPSVWPARIESSEFDRLPKLLYFVISRRKSDMNKEILFTICEGDDGKEASDGDVLIFPDMIRYRSLTHFDVDAFVEEVLVKDIEWLPGNPESIKGSYVFVCCHGSRNPQCGAYGPSLVSRFREEIELYGLESEVSVSPCSHVGDQSYTGDVIIYGSNINQRIAGHRYGYVTLEDVPLLVDKHIIKGEIVNRLWRGETGTLQDEKKTQELTGRLDNQLRNESNTENLKPERGITVENTSFRLKNSDKRSSSGRKVYTAMFKWLESWEKEDTFAALAVTCAAASVAIAYSCYKQLK